MQNSKLRKINADKTTKDFFDLLEALDKDGWDVKMNKSWTVKDCVAHLVGWEEENVRVLKKYQKTKKDPWFMKNDVDYQEFNRGVVDEYRNWNPKELISDTTNQKSIKKV